MIVLCVYESRYAIESASSTLVIRSSFTISHFETVEVLDWWFIQRLGVKSPNWADLTCISSQTVSLPHGGTSTDQKDEKAGEARAVQAGKSPNAHFPLMIIIWSDVLLFAAVAWQEPVWGGLHPPSL